MPAMTFRNNKASFTQSTIILETPDKKQLFENRVQGIILSFEAEN
jgi:hypothetical protein